MPSLNQDFSLGRLEALLKLAKKRRAFIRHDVDHYSDCALKMAEFESEMGVSSTYYLRSPSQARALVPRLDELGHTMGIHVDLRLPRDAQVNTKRMLSESSRLHEKLIDAPFFATSRRFPFVKKVSFHSPPKDILWRDMKGFEHALSKRWKGLYVSDSRGIWRYDPEEMFGSTRKKVQISLHPEWYFLPEPQRSWHQEQELAKP